jgi:radical SAM modification target selenobiotic family peptide
MDNKALKKLLAGFGIVGLVAGAGLTLSATSGTAASG